MLRVVKKKGQFTKLKDTLFLRNSWKWWQNCSTSLMIPGWLWQFHSRPATGWHFKTAVKTFLFNSFEMFNCCYLIVFELLMYIHFTYYCRLFAIELIVQPQHTWRNFLYQEWQHSRRLHIEALQQFRTGELWIIAKRWAELCCTTERRGIIR